MGPVKNYAKDIKKIENSKKLRENIDHRQIFIRNDHKCILIRNLDRLQHVKDVTKSRTIGT